ncbi:MAG TPA: DNA topoisomerase VI subunit B, partial [Candidatus Aenigmarchaeota archaeon]|nr:DNA topoisomerase VI subunit B [Candidatus Aenigmarchaeota archaeon]
SYIRQTAIANPYAHIIFNGPNGKIEFKRSVNKLPPLPKEIKPHPHGIELGILRRMLKHTKSKTVLSFLTNDFCRVGIKSAKDMCKLAGINPNTDPRELGPKESEKLFRAMKRVKLSRPPVDCLSPLGEDLILKGLEKEVKAEFFASVSRPPTVYRGLPFQVEAGIAYGGELPRDRTVEVLRLSNRVPLLYQPGDCAITKAVSQVDWRRYGLQQPGKSLPTGPAVILVHFASVWVPFISESKQAIASYPVIMKEIKPALQEVGRKLQRYVAGKRRIEMSRKRRMIFERYIPEVAMSLSKLTKIKAEEIKNKLMEMTKKKTEVKLVGAKEGSVEKTE